MTTPNSKQSGFTIVELLVVIVVIGILAAITIVSYTGISQKAIVASIQSDLSGASNRLKMYYVENGQYPQGVNYTTGCPTTPVDDEYCLKSSSGNTFSNYSSTTPYQTFTLDVTNTNTTKYRITNDSAPVTVTSSVPTLTSPTVTSIISGGGATLGANITSNGGATITARGTCWNTTPAPTANCLAEGGIATGVFTQSRTGIPSSTFIYFRGYATNSVGTAYSIDGTFTSAGGNASP